MVVWNHRGEIVCSCWCESCTDDYYYTPQKRRSQEKPPEIPYSLRKVLEDDYEVAVQIPSEEREQRVRHRATTCKVITNTGVTSNPHLIAPRVGVGEI